MTDKVQKIREEVVRMHNLLPITDGDNISVNYADRICTSLEMYIDSMQEEPAIPDIVDEHFDEMLGEEPVSDDLESASHRCYEANDTFIDGFKKGAYWQKQQMMKEAVKWIKEVDSHNYIMRYCDSCEPTVNELIEWFKNYMKV